MEVAVVLLVALRVTIVATHQARVFWELVVQAMHLFLLAVAVVVIMAAAVPTIGLAAVVDLLIPIQCWPLALHILRAQIPPAQVAYLLLYYALILAASPARYRHVSALLLRSQMRLRPALGVG